MLVSVYCLYSKAPGTVDPRGEIASIDSIESGLQLNALLSCYVADHLHPYNSTDQASQPRRIKTMPAADHQHELELTIQTFDKYAQQCRDKFESYTF